MATFFLDNIDVVYFFYGLSFFAMGLAVLLEVGHSSPDNNFSRSLRPLIWFGLLHGGHEWLEMFLITRGVTPASTSILGLNLFRVAFLALSFFLLLNFGLRLITQQVQSRMILNINVIAFLVWFSGVVYWLLLSDELHMAAADVYTRYTLAVPGGLLVAWGLVLQNYRFRASGMRAFGYDVLFAALAFGLYGIVGQVFASPSDMFPSNFLNSERFLEWFGFPVQVLRALMACVAAITITRSLRSFEVENAKRVESLHQAQLAERQHSEELRGELLHRTVQAQESERTRIARELHDEVGQTLTALGMGLRGLSDSISSQPDKAILQAKKLENVATNGITDLQRLVSGLHPPQLDDLGLLAGLRWLANDISQNAKLKVEVKHKGPLPDLTPEVRTVLFRIAQEALTNAVRHARANNVCVNLSADDGLVYLTVEDDGWGFDVQAMLQNDPQRPSWGLMGMKERASLLGGDCKIESKIGNGTRVQASIRVGG